MKTLNEYFDAVLCINLPSRTDRWEHAREQFTKHKIEAQRVEGVVWPKYENDGCVQAHATCLELIASMGWKRTLILEDDFEFRFEDSQEQFGVMVSEVPDDWQMLYLGGHYAEKPRGRVSEHVILTGHIKTTSSYGVTLAFAKEVAPVLRKAFLCPIDELYHCYNVNRPSYIFQPRLVVQYNNFSDIQQRDCNNAPCMEDTRHEEMV